MKKVLVIGATSAIAEHCARLWASEACRLFLVARNNARLVSIASDLRLRGAVQVATFCVDLDDFGSHGKLLAAAAEVLDGIDIVLIAHGTLSNQMSCERDVAETMSEIHTNALSTVSLLTIIANYFETKNDGTICVISSVAGDRGRASNYVYGSAKAMLSSFTSGLRQRLHQKNVAVVTIKPGFVDTPMTADFEKGLLWVKPNKAAKAIVGAINRRQPEVYVPWFWAAIMMVIRNIPHKLFVKTRL